MFFTSDTHISHHNIIKYCNRPFANAKEMDAEMIKRWNEKVKLDDTIYHLGDFTLGSKVNAERYLLKAKENCTSENQMSAIEQWLKKIEEQ